MIRVSKLADYSTVIMVLLAKSSRQAVTAREIAESTHIGLPTVSKLLKQLSHAKLVEAQRGAKGGYTLARPSIMITLAEIINALDGGVALTECARQASQCAMEGVCTVRNRWRTLNTLVLDILQKVTLQSMIE